MSNKISGKYLKMNKEDLKQCVLKERKRYVHKLPAYTGRFFDTDELVEGKSKCYRMIPKKDFNGTYIIYLYGSGMCKNISAAHWDFITKVALQTGCGLFVPMYPLAPEHCCREVFEVLEKAYANFTMGFDVEKVVLLGDSSGAGLALSLSMAAWKEGLRKPDQLIMLSPALDTEFFDRDLEKQFTENSLKETEYFFSEGAKDFINTYWVKDYAAKTEYTSPYYEDYTDLCNDVVIFSGEEDMFNCYARAFYQKAKLQGVNIRFFEFEGEHHEFMLNSRTDEAQNAFRYLLDVINGTYENSLRDLYPIQMLANWTKKYPDMISDPWASKFMYDNKIDFSGLPIRMSEYRDLVQAAGYAACDSKVRKYIMEYPNCTIVHIGCRLGNTFERVDNGRIQWYSIDTHNIMSVRRSMYGDRPREKTIGRSLMDFTWVDNIVCKRNQGVMFVCNDALTYLTPNQFKSLLDILRKKFPGAELVFTASTTGSTAMSNLRNKKKALLRKKKRMSINDAQKLLSGWRTDYKIMAEEPVMKYFSRQKGLKWRTRIGVAYNLITYNHKVIHVKLGSEAYEIQV